jgi:hypothetical protein
MRVITNSCIDGEFQGWDGGSYFRLENGEVWKQTNHKYHYYYAFRPRARVLEDAGRFILEVEGMPESVEVNRAPGNIFIYDSAGRAVGFWRSRFVYTLRGAPIGQIRGTHVHKLSGEYVGELYKDMVVDRHLGNLGNIGNPGNPGNAGNPGNPGNRGAVNYGYPDVFHKLLN